MALSSDLVSQFVKITRDEPKTSKETVAYGTIKYDGKMYVHLDGSEPGMLTPISKTTDVVDGDRVMVTFKDHKAIVTGNLSFPSARAIDLQETSKRVDDAASKIDTFEIVIADKVSARELNAEKARIDTLVSDNITVRDRLTATEASIETLEADSITIKGRLDANEGEITRLDTEKISADIADLKYATITNLEAVDGKFHTLESTFGKFQELTTHDISAANAEINNLKVNIFDANSGDIKFANIDFSNINEAAIRKLFSDTGLIADLIVDNQKITGELVGVTFKGDLIQGGTVIADKLVIKGNNGLYYKLNYESGALSGDEVGETVYYKVEYNSATGEYVATDEMISAPEGTPVEKSIDLTGYSPSFGSIDEADGIVEENEDMLHQVITKDLIPVKMGDKIVAYQHHKFRVFIYSPDRSYMEYDSEYHTEYTIGWDGYLRIAISNEAQAEFNDSAVYVCGNVNFITCTYTTKAREVYELSDGSGYYCEDILYPDWAKEALHGSAIVAKSITAEQISVEDLVAFNATIGGFHITDHSLYSGVKESVHNTTPGAYMDRDGQLSIGDDLNYLKFYDDFRYVQVYYNQSSGYYISDVSADYTNKSIANGPNQLEHFTAEGYPVYTADIYTDETETSTESVIFCKISRYRLDISADSVRLSSSHKGLSETVDDINNEIKDYHSFIDKFSKYIRFMEDESGNPSDTAMTIGSGDSTITLEIDNVKGLVFKKNGVEFGSWDGTDFHTGNIKIDVNERAQFGNFAYVPRNDGSLSFLKVGG